LIYSELKLKKTLGCKSFAQRKPSYQITNNQENVYLRLFRTKLTKKFIIQYYCVLNRQFYEYNFRNKKQENAALMGALINGVNMSKLSLNKFIFLIGSLIISHLSFAQTVSNYKYIESEISKLSEKSTDFDLIRDLFSKSPEYKTTCYTDPSNEEPASKAKDLFKKDLPEKIEGKMIFALEAIDLGFSVLQIIDLKIKGQNIGSEAQCVASTDGCISLNQSLESPYPELEQSGDYFPEVTKNEKWSSYIFDSRTIYSQLSLSLSIYSKDFFNRKSSAVTYSKSYLCISRLITSQTEL
jgi:hypothetical protein